MRISDWSSDVCSSDLLLRAAETLGRQIQTRQCERAGKAINTLRIIEPFGRDTIQRDAREAACRIPGLQRRHHQTVARPRDREQADTIGDRREQIGRATCRETVCTYV